MDFNAKISMDAVTIKALHWLLSNQKENNLKRDQNHLIIFKIHMIMNQNHQIRKIYKKMKIRTLEFKEYLEDTLISSGHQMMDTNLALEIHFYLLWEMTWTSLHLDAQIKNMKFIIEEIIYANLVGLVSW